ncbi:MAG: hypothetical protein AABX33_02245 [Nanoarchaeota archaeon]
MLHKKRGYFFVLDALLGLFILVIGVFLITSTYVETPKPTQVGLLSDSLIDFLSGKTIKNFNSPYAGIGGELWKQGGITNEENSLLQQIGEFYSTNRLEIAEKFIQNVSNGVIPDQFSFEVWFNNVILYPKEPSLEHKKSKSDSELLLTSKRITFGTMNSTTTKIWGPYMVEVFVWERGTAKVRTTFTEQSVCTNAESLGLCGGLDTLYAPGYKCSCCIEHSFCCAGCS